MRWLSALFALLMRAGIAQAQIGLPAGQAQLYPKISAAYSGPGDIVASAILWGGLRAYSTADRGTAVANVCDNTGGVDVNCADVSSDATTGIPPNFPVISGVTCTNGGSHPCTIKTLYNKGSSVGGNWTQATIASRPTWMGSAVGSLPAMSCTGAENFFSGGMANQSQPYSFAAVADKTGNLGSNAAIAGTSTGNPMIYIDSAAHAALYDGTILDTVAAANSAFHAMQLVFNSGSSSVNSDGTQQTGSISGTAISGNPSLFICNNSFGNHFIGLVGEVGYWAGAFTGTQITNMNSNQHSYWGF